MANIEIRLKIKDNRLRHYEIASELGISEYTFCKWIREELTSERKEQILSAIDRLVSKEACI